MKKLTVKQRWDKTVKWLRKTFPTTKPVIIYLVKTLDGCGDCELLNKIIRIRIKSTQTWVPKRDALMHEWAHAITLHETSREDHGNEWAIAYGKIYKEWVRWNYGRNT